jgi:phage baseplate assembly protein W
MMNNNQYEFHLEYTFASDAIAELNRKITLLLTTPVGTMPLDREFGTDWSFLDTPSEMAKSLFAAEIADKIETFIPEVRVEAVEWTVGEDGSLIPKVVITNGTD